ncbi:MAG: DUF2935 domain-containing protein [Clostridiales bacterium]|nr:DUF2935 domain-containing protein [Clostridiales bacterium]
MENYVSLSIETHLFFARIMKEHALFLEAGFPGIEKEWIKQADWYREQFQDLLRDIVAIAGGKINDAILQSCELVTEFTIPAENRTEHLTGIPIDSRISIMQKRLSSGCGMEESSEMTRMIHRFNDRAIRLLDGLILFKESILKGMESGQLFNANYPLLIKHIIREARLYRATIADLLQNRRPTYQSLCETEEFWNRIMMEHALFIRGLLDPSEVKLIDTADDFAKQYAVLLEQARQKDCLAAGDLAAKSLTETRKYCQFKAAGAQGILNCEIASIILPLLADHVLREANHYIRILECGRKA